MKKVLVVMLLSVRVVPLAASISPANSVLIPEARAVLEYLQSVYGRHTLLGISGTDNAGWIRETTGYLPAILSLDLCGWNSPTWGPTYTPVVERAVETARNWWARGGIVSMQFHWKHPQNPEGSAWIESRGGRPPSGPYDMASVTVTGTPAHEAFMKDLARHADYLERLAAARVPVLWRPFHEIDGGWFWWTDRNTPENTVAAWRLMFEYLVRERKLHNLIWVWSAALRAGGYAELLRREKRAGTREEELAFRRRYWPGDSFVDIAGIDIYPIEARHIYPHETVGYGPPDRDTYPSAWAIVNNIAPTKLIALCECQGLLDPERLERDGPRWLYVLPWFVDPPGWTRRVVNHPFLVTLDRLPLLNRDAAPCVRLTTPLDGAELNMNEVELVADPRNRGAPVEHVEFFAHPGPWKNLWMMSDEDLTHLLASAERVAIATTAPWTVRWTPPRAGLYTLIARATDREGRQTLSNGARVTAGLTNRACGGTWRASSGQNTAALAGDGDLFTAWQGAKQDNEWIAVDFGGTQRITMVAVSWWKAYARNWSIEVSDDGQSWRTVHTTTNKREFLGNTDLVRFDTVEARHLRLLCHSRATDWGGYTVYDLRVYREGLVP